MPAYRIGECLRSTRQRLGWSREVLAYRSGLSCAAISQIESGRRQEVRLGSVLALADALGVSVDYLVRGEAAAPPRLLRHSVLIYGSDEEYLASAVPFLSEGVARSERVLVVTTGRQIGLLRDALADDAAGVAFHDSLQWYGSPLTTLDNYRKYLADGTEACVRWARVLGEPVWANRSEVEMTDWPGTKRSSTWRWRRRLPPLCARMTSVRWPKESSLPPGAHIPNSPKTAARQAFPPTWSPRSSC